MRPAVSSFQFEQSVDARGQMPDRVECFAVCVHEPLFSVGQVRHRWIFFRNLELERRQLYRVGLPFFVDRLPVVAADFPDGDAETGKDYQRDKVGSGKNVHNYRQQRLNCPTRLCRRTCVTVSRVSALAE